MPRKADPPVAPPRRATSAPPLQPAQAPPRTLQPNFGRFARIYAPIEWLSFGTALSRRRECFLAHPRVASAQRALILGDGDGRFAAALLERNPDLELTVVDVSAAMLTQLERRVRVRTPNARLELHCADARTWTVPAANYDLVAAHFFFDCFTMHDLTRVISRISPALTPNALWLVSDFAIPNHPFWTPFARVLIRFLYLIIGSLTGLEHSHLPDHQTAMRAARFELSEVQTAFGGTLRSEIWQAPATNH